MKILVTGAHGQLGFDVCRELVRQNHTYYGPSSQELDITNRAAVLMAMQGYHPDAVIHCAAYTAVDRAEEEPERVFAVNEQGTRNIAEACKAVGCKLLYISTDYVFPGAGSTPYEVDAATGPLNAYGRSKLAGEAAVHRILDNYFIVRISWVFGSHGKNFVKTMLQLGERQTSVQVVNDQIGSPTYTVDLASLLCSMVQTEKYGVYHATNAGECSWAEFAKAIFQEAGKAVTVNEIKTSEYTSAKAARPLNSRLSKRSLETAGFSNLPNWRDALSRYLLELEKLDKTDGKSL